MPSRQRRLRRRRRRRRKKRLGFLREMERLGAPQVTESRPYWTWDRGLGWHSEMTTPGESYWRERRRLEGGVGQKKATSAIAWPSWMPGQATGGAVSPMAGAVSPAVGGGFPAAPGGYERWATPAAAFEDWYKPAAKKKGKQYAYLEVINRLLPFMAPEDIKTVTRQLQVAAPDVFKGYLGATFPAAPAGGEGEATGASYRKGVESIQAIVTKIPDKTAKAWASSIMDVYLDNTPETGMRTRRQEAMFKAQMDELMENIPEGAQPYAAAMQRLVMPTVAMPAREWYEMPAGQRTAPTSWVTAGGYRWNPRWM